MKTRHFRIVAFAAIWAWLCAAVSLLSADVIPGQIDDFEDGTTSGWQHGIDNPDAPRVVADGGPNGAGDAYLEVSSNGGFGPGSKLAMFNTQEHWTGSFLGGMSDPISELDVDLNNLGEETLTMRFMLEGEGGNVFTQGFELAPASGWQHAAFSLRPEHLISPGDLSATLASTTKLWLFHNTSARHPGPSSEAILGIDNLMAVGQIVEPFPPGDYNANGLVEQQDLDLVLANWGEPAASAPPTWVEHLPEGNIDQTELDQVLTNWGSSAGALGRSAAVPEPSTWVLLGLVATLLWRPFTRSSSLTNSAGASAPARPR